MIYEKRYKNSVGYKGPFVSSATDHNWQRSVNFILGFVKRIVYLALPL